MKTDKLYVSGPKDMEDDQDIEQNRAYRIIRSIGNTNPGVIQNPQNPNKFWLYERHIFRDELGDNSRIVRADIEFNEDGSIKEYNKRDKVVFDPQDPHGLRGVEDFRPAFIKGENVVHGFLVHYDGFNFRTEYIRTKENSMMFDEESTDNFGIYFPNITIDRALELVTNKRYKDQWEKAHGKTAQRKWIENKRKESVKSLLKGQISKSKKIHEQIKSFNEKEKYLGNKDCSLWPRKIDGQAFVFIRFFGGIQGFRVPGFEYLAKKEFSEEIVKNIDDYTILQPEYSWELDRIGLAGQPLEVPLTDKWKDKFGLEEATLIFYHGATDTPKTYSLGVALTDSNNPKKIIARSKKPILIADKPYEQQQGVIKHAGVVFPTSHHLFPDDKHVLHFYGASDINTCRAIQPLEEILESLERV